MRTFLLIATMMAASTCYGQSKPDVTIPSPTRLVLNRLSTTEVWHPNEYFVWLDTGLLPISTVLPVQNPVSSAQIGNATFNVPTTNPAVVVQTPARSGTMALLSDIVAGPGPAQSPRAKGIITLSSGAGSATLIGFTVIPVCVVSDPSGNSVRYANTLTVLTVSGVGPNVAYHCE